MTSRFTPAAERALNRALTEARSMGHTYVGSEHLLLGLLYEKDSVACRLLGKRGIAYETIRHRILETEGQGSVSPVTAADLSPRAKRILEEAGRMGGDTLGRIGTDQLLTALLTESDSTALRILREKQLSAVELRGDMAALRDNIPAGPGQSEEQRPLPPTLNKYGHDLRKPSVSFVSFVAVPKTTPVSLVSPALAKRPWLKGLPFASQCRMSPRLSEISVLLRWTSLL